MSNERGDAMAHRLRRAAARSEIAATDIARIMNAFGFALDLRSRVLRDPQHPAILHTGRTALILLEDLEYADADALALAALFESRTGELMADPDSIRTLAGERAAELAASLPVKVDADQAEDGPADRREDAGEDLLLETLLGAETAAVIVAISERLDHARHLHLEPRPEWAPFHTTFAAVYVPVAERTHPRLGRRCRWWSDMFAKKYLARPSPR